MILKIVWTSCGARPSEGSSTEHEPGRARSARPIAQHLLLAAGERPARFAIEPFLQA
jgi:hypothetical protein